MRKSLLGNVLLFFAGMIILHSAAAGESVENNRQHTYTLSDYG